MAGPQVPGPAYRRPDLGTGAMKSRAQPTESNQGARMRYLVTDRRGRMLRSVESETAYGAVAEATNYEPGELRAGLGDVATGWIAYHAPDGAVYYASRAFPAPSPELEGRADAYRAT